MTKTYDIVVRFHSVSNLPVADLGKFSSDPYLKIKLGVSPKKITESGWHVKENTGPDPDDPIIVFRTPTHHQTLHPIFPPQTFWVVSNVPESGFSMTVICRDEDPSNKDDGLGKTRIEIEGITGIGWKKEHMRIELRRRNGGGSWRAFAFSPVINVINGQKISSGRPIADMSIEVIGETKDNAGRPFPYTSGPAYFSKHFSPFAGRMTGIVEKTDDNASINSGSALFGGKKYNFQANALQLQGPVPPELNHPFVPSKWFIKKLFTGKILPHALHAHHRNIFSHDLKTVYGVIIQDDREDAIMRQSAAMSEIPFEQAMMNPSQPHDHQTQPYGHGEELNQSKLRRLLMGGKVEGDPEFKAMELENPRPAEGQPCGNSYLDKSQRFLEMCGELTEAGKVKKQPSIGDDGEEEEQTGGALFTYVVTTDGQMRWSEVGAGWAREVGSKHVILANGAKHVAFAGEFFIRRKPRKHHRRPSFAVSTRTGSSSSGVLMYRNSKNRDDRKKKNRPMSEPRETFSRGETMLGDTLPAVDRNPEAWAPPTQLPSWSPPAQLPYAAPYAAPHGAPYAAAYAAPYQTPYPAQYAGPLRADSASTMERDRDLDLMFSHDHSRRPSQISLNTSDQVRFQLYIDNDSGTYRPLEKHIPAFREFMKRQFPGFDVIVSHCAGEEGKKIEKMKQAHVRKGRERGEVAGDPGDAVEGGDLVFSDSSSSSSSSEDEDERGQYAERSGMGKGGKLPNGVQEFAEKYGIRLM
ncbi:hypothetical protein TWF718_006514 [Orbilia javanica]|uniref:C2 domain-containing protein n=1 Tax=Orbilia javanica TaxID=47235 RepID=A0AAN8N0Z4_9PEZI